MKKLLRRKLLILLLCCLLLLANFLMLRSKTFTVLPGYYRITSFFDGDTIEVDMNGMREKVRFIGVDTPETHKPDTPEQCYGKEASAYTKETLKNIQVRLEADTLSSNRDKYDRLLRYVYTTDGVLLNKELITKGYGFAMRSFEHSKRANFVDAETVARNEKVGLWNKCSVELNGYYHTNSLQ